MTTASVPFLKILDCRCRNDAERTAAVLQSFDGLRPGEALVFLADSRPSTTLEGLQRERKGLFEWTPIEEGPERWRVEVLRRGGRVGALREITEALSWDHDRLDALEAAAFEARAEGDLELARRSYRAFAHGLLRHIRFEEELLFRVFEERTGLSPATGPTAVMRGEHEEIKRRLQAIAAEIGLARPQADLESRRRAFHEVMRAHNDKEEEVLYPAVDRTLSPDESDALVAQIQAF
jgi:regulator of cell morphogenesis and NO signaling